MMTSAIRQRVERNLQTVRARIAAACAGAGRTVSEVRLVAVTKYAEWAWVEALIDAGVTDIGESRPQQLVRRAPLVPPSVRRHLIGHLQRNKVRQVLGAADWIHSIDSVRLLDRVEQIAAELGKRPRVLLEVNVSGETTKDGMSPGQTIEQVARWQSVEHVDLCGLMTMAPRTDSAAAALPYFEALAELRERLRELLGDPAALPELSMGMSNDFEAAIAAGATCVRIGSALFDGLDEIAGESPTP